MCQSSRTLHTFKCSRCPNKTPEQASNKPPEEWRWFLWPREELPDSKTGSLHLLCPSCVAAFFDWWDGNLQTEIPRTTTATLRTAKID